ncbi:MAG: hypothetical protein Q9167_004176 [Letrouitia subvulpina]
MLFKLICLALVSTFGRLHPAAQPIEVDKISADMVLYNRTSDDVNAGYGCYPRPFLPWRQLIISNCMAALQRWPNIREDRAFSRFITAGIYKLPQETSAGDCTVKVDTDYAADFTSWDRVKQAAMRVIRYCPPEPAKLRTYGGTSRTGNAQRIVVTVMRSGTLETRKEAV